MSRAPVNAVSASLTAMPAAHLPVSSCALPASSSRETRDWHVGGPADVNDSELIAARSLLVLIDDPSQWSDRRSPDTRRPAVNVQRSHSFTTSTSSHQPAPAVGLSVCLSVCLSVGRSVCLSVCRSVCLLCPHSTAVLLV